MSLAVQSKPTNNGFIRIGENEYPVEHVCEDAFTPQTDHATDNDHRQVDYLRIGPFPVVPLDIECPTNVITCTPPYVANLEEFLNLMFVQWFDYDERDIEDLESREEEARKIRNDHAQKFMMLLNGIFDMMDGFMELYSTIFKKDSLEHLQKSISMYKELFELYTSTTNSFKYMEIHDVQSTISRFFRSAIVEFYASFRLVNELRYTLTDMFLEMCNVGMHLEALDIIIGHFKKCRSTIELPEGREKRRLENKHMSLYSSSQDLLNFIYSLQVDDDPDYDPDYDPDSATFPDESPSENVEE